ncbi:thiol reductant ABC exporter subunit CydC [Dokdonella sp.]|uniref:thiol reductant ABC exporter subunit CydC n=1 Tax=Dokdonella sp. TaxID=2291710 RepID=UPI0031C8215F|nr:thiol reductant ABC exporter subunit CydC [Dokdonella sp.]
MAVQVPAPATPALLWRLLAVMRTHWGWMALGIALSLVSTLAGIGLLAVAGWFIASMGLAGISGAAINYFTPSALIRAFALLRIGGRYLDRLINHEATLRALSQLRMWLFGRILPLAPARTGFLGDAELFSRLRADIDRLEHAFLAVLVPVAVAALAMPVIVLVQAMYAPLLAGLTLVAALLVAVVLPLWLLRRSRGPGAAIVALESEQRALASDSLRGAAELALYGAGRERAQRLEALTGEATPAPATPDRLQSLGAVAVPLAAQGLAAASLLLATGALQRGALAAPDVAMLVLLALAAFEVLAPLPEAFAQGAVTGEAARRVFALADTPPAVHDPAHPAPPPTRFDLHWRDVRLRYADAGPWALDGLDLDLPYGSRVAISGPSGAGKSSLVHALLRFHPIQRGAIALGGRAIDEYAAADVRAAIAVAEQQPHIFNASLRENLCIARPAADAAAIDAALACAQLQSFVAALPDGLDTWLGEGGVRISGGEARRVAIARALLAERPILILDEPLEGLDAVTARALLAALAHATRGRSVLVISHRAEGLASLVDRQVSMQAGRLIAAPSPVPDAGPA